MKKILLGMSGGVDSSAAAVILKNAGYEVAGVTLRLYDNADLSDDHKGKTCCSLKDVEDARSAAYRAGIEHYVFNFGDDFRRDVMQSFCDSYMNGETPNPCIECNKHIKFGKMLRRAEELGFDGVATGHYARIEYSGEKGRWLLKRAADETKDQTYVLYGLTQDQLSKTVFPLGDMTKAQAREIAGNAGLINAKKPDSQDICFVPDGDYGKFIEHFTGKTFESGNFTDVNGNVVGTHKNQIFYTVGQRRGLGVTFGKPVFVCGKNAAENTVILGENKDLMKTEILVRDVNLISVPELNEPFRGTAKLRYSQKAASVTVYPDECGLRLVFDEPQRAPAAGQAAVIYDGDYVFGGGVIVSAK